MRKKLLITLTVVTSFAFIVASCFLEDTDALRDEANNTNGFPLKLNNKIDIGVTAPVIGKTPVTTITTAQYTGTVKWEPGETFKASTNYTATITLKGEPGYSFREVTKDSFTVRGATVMEATANNETNSVVITAVFPKIVGIPAIQGVTAPVVGETPKTTITETAQSQYTGTITWSPAHNLFKGEETYTATIRLTAKTGYTLQGVNDNFFTVAGAALVSNSANSGVVRAEFSITGAAHTVSFDANGGEGMVPDSKIVPVSSTSTTLPSGTGLSKSGYTFGGWNTKSTGMGTSYSAGASYTPTRDITLYAKWNINSPTGLSATTDSSNSMSLSWSSVSGAHYYKVYQATSATGTYSSVGQSSDTSYTDTNLSPSTPYYYKVSAFNYGNESSQSSYAFATTRVGIPTGLSATGSSNNISLSWYSVSGASYYQVYRSSSTTGTYSSVGTSYSTSYTDYSLSSSTTYYYKVSAINSNGNEGSQSLFISAMTSGGSAPSVPLSPSLLSSSSWTVTSNSISLSWNSVSEASYYNVYRSSSFYGTYSIIGQSPSTSYTDTGLSSSTIYYYKVSAVNSSGASSQSSSVSATTSSNAPETPTGLSATADSSNSINLSWSSVSGASYYQVCRSSTNSYGDYPIVDYSDTPSYTDTGLSSSTTYYYKVSAVNSSGYASSQSSYASATTTSGGGGSGTRSVTIDMYDSNSDGWDGGGALRISVNNSDIASNVRVSSGNSNTYTFNVTTGNVVQLYWVAGSYQGENSFIVYYTGTPPSPAFTSSNNSSWSGSNALVYKLRGTMDNISGGTLLGSFTVP